MIGLDACFLKGSLRGQLMAAIARDENNQMFPLAIAVVESECKESWTWFLESLIDQIGVPEEKGWTFMSDQQKGLLESFKKVMPNVDHRFCVRHMYANFKLRFKDKKLKDLMWAVARSYTIVDFEKYMELIKKENTEAHRWLSKIGTNQWSKSAFSTLPKCDMLSNNNCEIFNYWIQEARDQPILTMLEIIRRKMMCGLQERCEWIKDYDGQVCPRIMEKIEETKEQTLDCEPIEAGNGIWEVHEGLKIYVKKLKKNVCTCREWDVTGIPCRHRVSAIMTAHREPEDFVHPFYHVSTFKKAYYGTIIPISDQSQWDIAPRDRILPPECHDLKSN
ncbi:uncharacterized protein LOC142175360 [Nicotiana tabacum]|uniref:Uncharacterized protein LOC142175360 n=1 Tax=Nicotiana tabacum TaxID=4097 RepID=A0AC58TLD9_TOBAC